MDLSQEDGVLVLANHGQHQYGLSSLVHLVQHMLAGQADAAHALAVLWRSLVHPRKFSQAVCGLSAL